MQSESSSAAFVGAPAPAERAFALASRLRSSADVSEQAIGEFVTHGLMSALVRSDAPHEGWRLPLLAEALRLFGYFLRNSERNAHAAHEREVLTRLLEAVSALEHASMRRSPSHRSAWRRLAAAALRDQDFMIGLSSGRNRLPVAEDIDGAIDEAVRESPGAG